MLAIPTTTALVLGGLRTVDEMRAADQFAQTTAQVDLAIKVTDVVHQVQHERMLAVSKIINPGDVDLQTALNAQIQQSDTAVSALRDAAAKLELGDSSGKVRYDRGLARLEALAPLRTSVNTPPYTEQAAFTAYSSVLESLVRLGREMTSAMTDPDLLRQAGSLQAISEVKEAAAREDAALSIAALRNEFGGVLLDQARSAQFSGAAALALFESEAGPDQIQLYTDTVSGPEVDGRERLAATAFARAANGVPIGINRAELASDSATTLTKLRGIETTLLGRLRARTDELAGAATTAAWRDSAIVLFAIIVALVLTVLVVRMMLKPLRVLRTSALEIAYHRLPQTVTKILEDSDPVAASANAVEPVPITTREEIGELARSFDAVHEQAIKMAAEQALLRENVNGIFVNLSRRSQRLVERQLGVIDRLEADEQDPDHLASLFELDHLATRLRRNGESLLVLSGAGLAKSVPKPVSAADVIGAAVSEIEQYARIEVGVIPEVAVRGLTVHDLVHLLAELLDNAAYFSEPETRVSVRAVVTRRKALAIQITDRGVGMSEEQIAEINRRLADPPELDVSVTRRMGLYVVARLAQRHGIEVRLRENEDIEGGVIARVVVPAELLGPVTVEAPSPPTPAETSLPEIAAVPAQRPRPVSAAAEQLSAELTPLAQPISLDELVAGSPNAAYLSRGSTSGSLPLDGHPAIEEPAAVGPLELPRREPRYIPPEPQVEPPAPAIGESAVLDDDVPTRRLPIYQSVVSRWFSADGTDGEDGTTDTSGTGDTPAETDEQDVLGEGSENPMTGQLDEPAEPLGLQEPRADTEDDWQGVADAGWQAAQALLESKNEEITTAGLPKRVPNAYLVPGSVNTSGTGSFVDETLGLPGPGAVSRSATAARDRMASFQRGYTSGRHALEGNRGAAGEQSVSVSGGEQSPPEYGSEE
ncbi:sensor histidine kinase [Amycolatopsis rhizosphaerae]|uniref:sensor histidine kinase n=1 Tax=Amycolatopsis rhizosphaerae TaxID=2053003 RepID=UPI001FE76EB0|nr:nitrate- and nitrite sensing domain-containing protein [Amycolatopsis rhizosphaerae]